MDVVSLRKKDGSADLLYGVNPIHILAVEDDLLSMTFLEKQIDALGHRIHKASNGHEALAALAAHPGHIDVVLMDREMPVMDGLEAVKRIKQNPALRNIPIIMVTSADSLPEMREGLDAGVFYYLTKPVKDDMLRSVLSAAVREAQQSRTLAEELGRHKTSFNLIDTCKFRYQTLAEAESLAAFIANCFPDPERVLGGLGELLINAIEHGNLDIGYDRKTELVALGTWRAEVDRRQALPEHNQKFATATIARKEDGIYVIIEDEGTGFDWKKYLRIDPARAGDNHGRGIAQARAISFDRMNYNEAGNKVVVCAGHDKRLEW